MNKNDINNTDNKKTEKNRMFSETFVFAFLFCVALVLLYGFLYYNSLYDQSNNGVREVLNGIIDENSAEFGYSHRTTPTVQFSINGVTYKAPTKRFQSAAFESVQPVIDELNAKGDVTVTYIEFEKLNLYREKSREIIGLKIGDKEYLDPDESIKELAESYKSSKNTCLVFAILVFIGSGVYFFFNIYKKKLAKAK